MRLSPICLSTASWRASFGLRCSN
uniref:Uncharacterized protein n=1 Tax=Arundo donax TaxID=35708 RepID=A0A0A9C0W6_ARUDO